MELEKLKAIEEAEQHGEEDAHALAPSSSLSQCSAQEQTQRSAKTWSILRKHPLLLVAPTLLLIVMIALCVFGVTYATDTRIETVNKLTQVAARDAADALRLQLSVVSSAALTLATFVVRDPNWNRLEEDFLTVSKEIFRQANQTSSYELAEIQYAPFGKISANYAPPEQARGPVRTDLFAPENVERTQPFVTVKLKSMTINGPLPLTVGGRMAILARYPVFIKNVSRDENWNHPFNYTAPTGCDELCYDEKTGTKFWGFTAAFFYADALLSGEDERLRQLVEEGYQYRITKDDNLTSPSPYDDQELLVKSSGWDGLKPTALVDVRVPGAAWFLSVYTPEIDEIEDMRDGLIAMIVICSFLLSGLLLMLLVSNKRAALLLEEQLATNTALEKANEHLINTKRVLEEEKQQREALLGRQYQLISCFERKGSKDSKDSSGKKNSSSLSPSVADKQLATLEQIATLRRAMDEERHTFSPNDDIRFFELLGEGTFGKVHRGTWRSTEVAIKTILLPANMSGAEKREKMVVWEAAISSSLTHPNIVQTYTYSIKPVREHEKHSTAQRSFADSMSGLGSAVQICGETEKESTKQGNTQQGSSDKSSDGGAIHSFEVSLVLEYCDQGTLRDALDQGAFMTAGGLNYPAILDSAEDVARAMLHLHCNNILHMDLKARNILLASSGSEGRGVTCKASDFGLAVRMEQAETHMSGCFQGTLTHMAPETLLKGQVSKAADVYAFGIVLWELFTGGSPYKGIPKALLGHKVAAEHHRPPLPFVMPQGYQALIQACWARNPEKRPTFAEILERLQALRSCIPAKTEPLGPISRPQPKGSAQRLPSANKLRPGSLHTVSEHASHSQPQSASAIVYGKGGSSEHPSIHSMRGVERPAAHAFHHSSEEQRHRAGPPPSGDFAAHAAGALGERGMGTVGGTGKGHTIGNHMLAWLGPSSMAPLRERSSMPEVHSRRSSLEGLCEGVDTEEQGHRALSEGAGLTPDADEQRSSKGGDTFRSFLRRSNSLPSMPDEERGVPEQMSGSGLHLQPDSGTRLQGSACSSHGAHNTSRSGAKSVGRRQGAGPFLESGLQSGNNDTWLPFAPQQLLGRPADAQPVAEAVHPRHHHHKRSHSAEGQGEAAPTSSHSGRWKPSRTNRSHGCVMVIGADDPDGSYRENILKEGSQVKGRVELSSIRTRAVLGNMLDPIGESPEDTQEG